MSEDTVVRFRNPDSVHDALTELLREGAGQLLRQAVQSELDELLGEHAEKRDARRQLISGNALACSPSLEE